MSAAVNKPKAAKKAPARKPKKVTPPSWTDHIAQVRKLVSDAVHYACGALQKVSTDNHAHGLLNSAGAELAEILRQLDETPFTADDADFLNSDGMYPALAMLAGAVALAQADPAEAALVPAIQTAYDRLNAAHNGLDSAVVGRFNPPAPAPSWPELAQPIIKRVADILQHAANLDGQKSSAAFGMLGEVECALYFTSAAPLSDSFWKRDDPSHAVAVIECVRGLMEQAQAKHIRRGGLNAMQALLMPGLLHVLRELAAALARAPADVGSLAAIPMILESAVALAVPGPDASKSPAAQDSDDTPTERAWWRSEEALGVLDLIDKSNAVYGARELLAQAMDIMKEQAPGSDATSEYERASLKLSYVIDILRVDGAAVEDKAQDGALTLVRLAKDHLDSHWDKVPRHA